MTGGDIQLPKTARVPLKGSLVVEAGEWASIEVADPADPTGTILVLVRTRLMP